MEYREFRAGSIGEGDDGKLILRAAPFNSETVIGDLSRGGWKEEIAPGCFTKALREGDTLLLADHDMAKPVARTGAGTLRLTEGKTHLEGDADPTDTSYYRDLRANIKSGNKGGMSIGFIPVKDEWFDNEGRPSTRMTGTRRVLREVKLPEVSIVTNPAYKDTAVFARDDSTALLEERAAKASYADLETCGECGATGQYGAYCSGCGEPMKASKPAGAFCTSCGGALDADSREAHECDETRASKKPYGDVKYADPKNGKYPIDNEEHIRAAWDYINVAKNADEYPLNGVTLDSVKSAIRSAAKGIGMKISQKSETEDAEGRDDPDGKEYEAIDAALRQLKAGDAKGAEKTLAANQATRSQEPDASTPEDGADDFALWVASREADQRSRELGYAAV